MVGATTSGFFLGAFAILLGIALTAAALRRRSRRALYGETYHSTGGVVYTAVQIGCAGLFIAGGVALILLAALFRH